MPDRRDAPNDVPVPERDLGPPAPLGPAARRTAKIRLAAFVLGAAVLFATATATGILPSASAIRAWVAPYGAVAPLLFIPLSALLSSTFVPGGVLAAAAGLLFGVGLGLPISLASATLAAVAQLLVGRHLARPQVEALLPPGARRYDELLERRGFFAVVWLRLVPGLPDTPVNYAAGLAKVRPWQMAAGTLVGALPRAFAYVALGGSGGDLASTQAKVGLGVLIATGIAGLLLTHRQLGRARRARRRRGRGSLTSGR